jgi:hypothetical protein
MSNDRSREGLLRFLDYMANKGLAPSNTISARKVTASKVLGILSEDEATDVIAIDLPQIMARFNNLKGQEYSPGSLATYQSRLKSALEDFDSYLKNPLGFRPSGQQRERSPKQTQAPTPANSRSSQTASTPSPMAKPAVGMAENLLPIPIRADLTIFIQGLPFDLTKAEASKIAAVVMALSSE